MAATPERVMIWTDTDYFKLSERINEFIVNTVSKVIDLYINNFKEGSKTLFYAYMRYVPQ